MEEVVWAFEVGEFVVGEGVGGILVCEHVIWGVAGEVGGERWGAEVF